MNLRVQSGLAHSFQALDAFLISFWPSTAVSGCGLPYSIQPASSCLGRDCVSNSLQGHQLFWRVGAFNLWIQVQKETKPVDFTGCGALFDELDSNSICLLCWIVLPGLEPRPAGPGLPVPWSPV